MYVIIKRSISIRFTRSNSDEYKKSYRASLKRFEEFVKTKFNGTLEDSLHS
jgi:hypothetical protein